jgi:1-acyl-sn-glycerol-3-phosphate acyltransferase
MNPFNYLMLISSGLVSLSVLFYAPVVLLATSFGSRRLTTLSIRFWMRWVMGAFFLRVKVEGLENYDPAQPALLVSNHQSHLDIPALYTALSGHIRMVGKQELFDIPVFGACLKACECIPIARESRHAGAEVSRKIRDKIRSGLQIWVAPEGTRSPDGVVRPFKRGSFGIAIDAGVPIQPIVILDARLALPKSSIVPRPFRTVHLKILPPINTQGMGSQDKAGLAERCRQMIISEMKS